ncbi:hypothetical protein ACFV7Q_02010 [Streptomyces sp. NPDC059851]|uniref:hypothetical protein n=1 Tax=Streptomyces sp. NPDC059851 TaxID=3346971 RepID=UPI0036530768
MDDAGLSDREQRSLSAIEAEAGRDRSLDRILRFGRLRHRAMAACALGVVTVGLLIAASITVSPPLVWGFAAAWTLTVAMALPLFAQWLRHRWQVREHTGRAG